jgi:poly(A)-specific ribonuclease
MEVTKENFSSVLKEIPSLLSKCCLASFDCEFTGLRGSEIRENWEDTLEERYCKLKNGSSEFTLIQYGICLFVQQDKLKYEVFPFNFYLFPSFGPGHKIPRRLDRCFRCQPSSLLLLANSGLDFNKWIKEGIPYMKEADELWWRAKRKEVEQLPEDDLSQFLGFSRVFKMIVDSKIPLVGHSVMLDLVHTYTHFISDLPEELMTFKSELNKRLPSLYDTLLMCENDNIRPLLGPSLSLANVYSALTQQQFPQVSTVFPRSCADYTSGNHLHEAAYDAYLSGYIFVVMANILGKEGTADIFEVVEAYRNRYNN